MTSAADFEPAAETTNFWTKTVRFWTKFGAAVFLIVTMPLGGGNESATGMSMIFALSLLVWAWGDA